MTLTTFLFMIGLSIDLISDKYYKKLLKIISIAMYVAVIVVFFVTSADDIFSKVFAVLAAVLATIHVWRLFSDFQKAKGRLLFHEEGLMWKDGQSSVYMPYEKIDSVTLEEFPDRKLLMQGDFVRFDESQEVGSVSVFELGEQRNLSLRDVQEIIRSRINAKQ